MLGISRFQHQAVGDRTQESPDSQCPLPLGILVDSGQAQDLAEVVPVDAHDGKIIRDAQAEVPGGQDSADRHFI